MTQFRIIPLAVALAAASALYACSTTPTSSASPAMGSMVAPEQMAKMDTQMKAMREMHDKMMAAKTPEERSKMMAAHMATMQDGMTMMGSMSSACTAGMKDMEGMSGDKGPHDPMMAKHMEMMKMMMTMMKDQMPPSAGMH